MIRTVIRTIITLFAFFYFDLFLREISLEAIFVLLATTALLALDVLSPALQALCPPPKD